MKYLSTFLVIAIIFLQFNQALASEIIDPEINRFFEKSDKIYKAKNFEAVKQIFSPNFRYYSYSWLGTKKVEESFDYDQYLNELWMYFNSDAKIKKHKTYIEKTKSIGSQVQVKAQISSVVEFEDFTSYCNVSALYVLTKDNDKIAIIDFAGVAECNDPK